MRCVWLLVVLVLVGGIQGLDYVQYQGLRLDLSALTFNRDILTAVVPALNRTWHTTFKSYKEPGSFFSALEIRDLKITYYKVSEDLMHMNHFDFHYPVYTMTGEFEAIYFHIQYVYVLTWLGIPVNWGRGIATVTNLASKILVLWNETEPDVVIPHPWDVKNVTLISLMGPTDWVKTILHRDFVPDFHKAVDASMYDFAHILLRTYSYIEDIFPFDVDLVFRNDILSVQPTSKGDYLTVAFKTNITVNKSIKKKMYRTTNGTVAPRGDFDYCLPAQLVPDVLDLVGKGGLYDHDIPASDWGFPSFYMKEIFEILPSLKEFYKETDTFSIRCESTRYETANDITERGSPEPLLQLQYPVLCFFFVGSIDEYFMIVDMYLRFYYEMKSTNTSYYGHVRGSTLYDFRVVPILPEKRKGILYPHVAAFMNTYNDRELLSPGIKVFPNREKQLKFGGSYIHEEEICFYYDETRPVGGLSSKPSASP